MQCASAVSNRCKNPSSPSTEATTAAMRADYDAKVAELKADLEGTRSEKENTATDLAILKVRPSSCRYDQIAEELLTINLIILMCDFVILGVIFCYRLWPTRGSISQSG